MLVDFAPSVSEADRLGIEAAALGSGIADAWLSPDGRLLARDDGALLLDTQLDARAPSPAGPTLADVLVADGSGATESVPENVVVSVLTRIGCTATVQAAGPETHLVIGRDGSWRAGALAGAFQADTITLIGASNRESARLAALAEIRRQMDSQREELRHFEDQDTSIATSLARLESERAGLPPDDEVRRLYGEAQDAASRTVSAAAEVRTAITRTPPRSATIHRAG
ncbi:MAG TPA: hypothetical protein VMV92_34260 [Streptosporangiaceae bacterium]|nr:hypothetical protein [Streptosporangiaceae bacterium]